MAITESELKRCPICFSILIEPYSNLERVATYLKEQNALPQSVEISKENTNLKDLAIESLHRLDKEAWKDDPILTVRGYAGENYKGFDYCKKENIESIQKRRKQQEINIGLAENNRTEFTEFDETKKIQITKTHIEELRNSTEKILKEVGYTKNIDGIEYADLNYYFSYDENGDFKATKKYDIIQSPKIDWTDVDRDIEGFEHVPKIPEGIIDIKNIHIEDLRHTISLGWFEDFTGIEPIELEDNKHILNMTDETEIVDEEGNKHGIEDFDRGTWVLGETYVNRDHVIYLTTKYYCKQYHIADTTNQPESSYVYPIGHPKEGQKKWKEYWVIEGQAYEYVTYYWSYQNEADELEIIDIQTNKNPNYFEMVTTDFNLIQTSYWDYVVGGEGDKVYLSGLPATPDYGANAFNFRDVKIHSKKPPKIEVNTQSYINKPSNTTKLRNRRKSIVTLNYNHRLNLRISSDKDAYVDYFSTGSNTAPINEYIGIPWSYLNDIEGWKPTFGAYRIRMKVIIHGINNLTGEDYSVNLYYLLDSIDKSEWEYSDWLSTGFIYADLSELYWGEKNFNSPYYYIQLTPGRRQLDLYNHIQIVVTHDKGENVFNNSTYYFTGNIQVTIESWTDATAIYTDTVKEANSSVTLTFKEFGFPYRESSE